MCFSFRARVRFLSSARPPRDVRPIVIVPLPFFSSTDPFFFECRLLPDFVEDASFLAGAARLRGSPYLAMTPVSRRSLPL